MNKTGGMILVEGNAAAALGCMMAGVTVVAWYPITPSSSLPETLIGYMKKYRIDKATGKATFAIVQAEDEIAAIGMVVGAGWAGARAMTSTSGPGHLADERVRRARVLRGGAGRRVRHPARRAVDRAADSHRAGRHPQDRDAVARRHQADPAHPGVGRGVLHDGDGRLRSRRAVPDAGVRHERPRPRDEHLDVADVHVSREAARSRQSCSMRRRWRGSASGAATRTSTATAFLTGRFPATACPPYFTRGSGHNDKGQYSERPDDYVNNMERLARKFETARQHVPKPSRRRSRRRRHRASSATAPATGRSTRAGISSSARPGSRPRYLRLRAYPFTDELGGVHRPLQAHLRRRAESRRADAGADAARAGAPTRSRSCAACCTTTGCRSMRGRSPTRSWRRRA